MPITLKIKTRDKQAGGAWSSWTPLRDDELSDPAEWLQGVMEMYSPGMVFTIKTRSGHKRQWRAGA